MEHHAEVIPFLFLGFFGSNLIDVGGKIKKISTDQYFFLSYYRAKMDDWRRKKQARKYPTFSYYVFLG